MNKLIIAVALSMIAGQVFATGKDHHGNHGNNNGPKNGGSTANSTSASGAFSAAGAVAGAASISGATGGASNASGGQGGAGGSAAGGTAVASVGALNFTFTPSPSATSPSTAFVQHDYGSMPNNTPAMGNSYISTSNSCDGAVGASLVLPGFGGSVSAAKLRMMCEGRLNAQAHKALGQEAKAQLTMEVVQEYACEEDSTWAKIARKKGLCAPADEATAVAQTNPAFNSK